MKTSRFFCLDIARGLAIIWIILYHVKESDNELDYGNIFNSIMSHGHLGVQIFFLISGYSIYSYLASNRDILSGLNFLLKRLRRVYIPYWWSLIFAGVVVPITIVMLNYIKHAPSSIKWINYSVIDWIEVTTLIRVFFSDGWDLSVPFKPLWANWYIAIIVQIYLVIALSLSLRVHLHKTCLFLSFASMLTIIPAVKDIIPVGLFLPYWIEFASGMLLFYVIHELGCYGYPSHKTRVILAFLLTVLSIFLYIITDQRVFFCLSAASIAYIAYPYDCLISEILVAKRIAFIGKISYSLYLIHIPLLWIMLPNLYVFRMPIYITNTFITLLLVIIISYVWYIFFEKQSTVLATALSFTKPFDTIQSDLRSNDLFIRS